MKNFYLLSAILFTLTLNSSLFAQIVPCDVELTYTTGGAGPVNLDYNLSNTSITTCSGNLFDPGGTGNYSNSTPLTTMTICSDQPGEQVILDFSAFPFQVETNFDFLRIYNGVGTGGTQLWNSQTSGGATNPGVITSTSGCLTITFSSDGSVTYGGWQAAISCTNPTPPGLDCNGGEVTLTAVGTGESNQLMNNNFNSGTAGPGWNSTGGASFGTPCGANPSGTPYYWASTAVGTPQLTTVPFDVSCGGSISFDMAYSTQGGASPCEGPDLPNEGVTFQYSTDGGTTWVVLGYWDPLGGYDANLTSWNTYTLPIPPAAAGPNTMFQWIQLSSSGTCCDNWGLDNVNITSPVNCGTYTYDYDQVPGTDNNPVQTENITSTTTFTVTYGNGVDECEATITIVVPPGTTADAGPDQTLCAGAAGVTIGADPVSLDESATYVWSTGATGTVVLTGGSQDHGQITVSPAVTTSYFLEVTFNGCTAYDTVVVTVDSPPTASNPAPISVNCAANVPAPNINVVTTEADDITIPPTVTYIGQVSNGGSCPEILTRTYRITDACNNFVDVTQTITIMVTAGPVLPPNGASTVNCVAAATQPAAPLVTDQCGNNIVPVITAGANPACEGTKVYTYTYTDCAGNSGVYTYTYTIDLPAFTIPTPNATANVVCIGDVIVPTPPAGITDACGNAIVPVMTENANPVCTGDKIYTFTYTDCAGNTAVWTSTFTINDNVNPTGTAPGDIAISSGAIPAADVTLVTDEADNCTANPTVTWQGDVSDGGNCPETITRTYRITDDCGNFIDVTQIITVGDAILPTASNPADIIVECMAQVPPANPAVVTDEADNGTMPVVTFESEVVVGSTCPDALIRTYRVTDNCGNFILVTQNVIIEPATNPVVPANNGSTVNCLTAAQVQPAAPAVTDVCGNALTPVVTTPANVACEGTMAWIFTYTDCAGNTSDWTYTYTIDLPTFTLPADDASTVNCLVDAQVQPVAPVMNDMCGNAITPVLTTPANIPCEGTMAWIYTYTDCAGNTADWTYTYTIDILPFTLPADDASTVNCLVDAQVQPVAPVMNDMCGNAITPVVTVPANIPCEGTMAWVFTYTDCAGNTADWTYTYTIDILPFTLPADDASTVNCLVDAQVQPVAPVMNDMCGNAIAPVVTAPANIPCEGTMAWVYTYTDCAGNTADWTYTYTIDIPAFTIPYANDGSVVNCLADANVQPADPGVVMDECGNVLVPVITAPSPSGCTGMGADWVFTYTDCAGNTADWTYTYTINLTPFAIPFADDASTVNCLANAQVQPVPPGVVNDVCGNAITPVVTVPANIPCEGTMAWVFTYTDCAGNTADWTYTYTIDIPTFTLPAGAASTVNCLVDAQVQPVAPVMNDMCGNAITPVVTVPADIPCEGTMAWIFTYTDCAGNTADWTYTYTIDIPTFTLPADAASTVNCLVDAQVQPVAPVMNDMCGNAITPVVTAPANIPCEGTMPWVFTYTDCAGNTADWTYTYTIDIPAFVIPYADAGSVVNCIADANVQPADPGVVMDECGNVLAPVITAPAPAGCTGMGADWIFTYTDCAGNTADWTYTYTINLSPFALPFADDASTVNCLVDAQVQPTPPSVVNDMCGNAITPVVTVPANIPCEGNMAWVFTYTDCAGNAQVWTYTYTIDIPAFALATTTAGSTIECLAQVAVPVPPVVNDACGNAITPAMVEGADPVCEGDKIFTFTYTDCAGNTADWTYTYTIDVVTSPVVPANGSSNVACITDVAIPAPPAVTDVCGNAIVPVMTENADPVCVGDKIYTFTYTDCAGNSSVWTYTFSINDNVAPTASNPLPISVPGSMDVPAPDVTVVIDEADNCTTYPVVAWEGDLSDGNVCNLEVITRTYSVTDDCGNVTLVTQEITILATNPPIDAGADQLICEGESITLTADNPWNVPISWNPANPPVDGQPFVPTQTDTYTVTADNLGCISTDQVTISVEELPAVSFIADVMGGCAPLDVTFTNTSTAGSALANCVWSINGTTLSGCDTLAYTFQNGGLYDVSLTTTSVNGCTNDVTYSDYIFVEDYPVAAFTPSTTELSNIYSVVNFTNNSQGATSYQWDFGDGSSTTSVFEPTHEFPNDNVTTFQVQLVAYSETFACPDTAWAIMSVGEELIYYIPNTFTPDNDKYNETFRAVFTSGFDPYNFSLFIYNRWGETIWESHDASVGWDGTYGGRTVQEGTYTWKIEFKKKANDERIMVTGHVNVLR